MLNGRKVVSANPNLNAQILLDGAQEILGRETLRNVIERISPSGQSANALAHAAGRGSAGGSPALGDAGSFVRALEEIYGAPGGRGLALRIGRASFRSWLKYFGDKAGFRTTEFRLLPAPRRLKNGLQTLAQFIGEESGRAVSVSDGEDCWLWRVDSACSHNCFLIAGLLQEFTTWAGGGRFYRVVETECLASGGLACVDRIEKNPLD